MKCSETKESRIHVMCKAIETTLTEGDKLWPSNFSEFLDPTGKITNEGVNLFCILLEDRTRCSPEWQCLVSYDALDLSVDKEIQIIWPLGPVPVSIYGESTFAFQGPKGNSFSSIVSSPSTSQCETGTQDQDLLHCHW